MSKYDALWACLQKDGNPILKLTFAQIQEIAGVPIDHLFLRYEKEYSLGVLPGVDDAQNLWTSVQPFLA